tara:strand:- start:85 stop:444 length:360 start_codon:yes stop_codon:yes gene_type:complete
MTEDNDRYIVTMYREGDCITRFAKYGRQGHIEAIESVDWEVHNKHARRATVERELPGGELKMVYEREQDTYEVTGVDRSGRRFKQAYKSKFFAMGVNLWRGSVWHVRDGKRKLIKRVTN